MSKRNWHCAASSLRPAYKISRPHFCLPTLTQRYEPVICEVPVKFNTKNSWARYRSWTRVARSRSRLITFCKIINLPQKGRKSASRYSLRTTSRLIYQGDMGGSAFISAGLTTPRMPVTVYRQVLKHTHAILKEHFTDVGTPSKCPTQFSFHSCNFSGSICFVNVLIAFLILDLLSRSTR